MKLSCTLKTTGSETWLHHENREAWKFDSYNAILENNILTLRYLCHSNYSYKRSHFAQKDKKDTLAIQTIHIIEAILHKEIKIFYFFVFDLVDVYAVKN